MPNQTTHQILMVRPANFGFNEETAASNAFQHNDQSLSPEQIKHLAIGEFDEFVKKLRREGIEVFVQQDNPQPAKPDAVFPNNWITMHQDGTMVTYPMYAEKRRLERDPKIIKSIKDQFKVVRHLHLEEAEQDNIILEGTGSLILDRQNKLAYACRSPRTDEVLLDRFCQELGYGKVVFDAFDKDIAIYHTNVMMALGETFVVICLDSVTKAAEREMLVKVFRDTNKEMIEISLDQMNAFAGNMLQVRNKEGQTFLVMSTQAFESLTDEQIKTIEKHTRILHSNIRTIETYGGGSARCMMAEIFLPREQPK